HRTVGGVCLVWQRGSLPPPREQAPSPPPRPDDQPKEIRTLIVGLGCAVQPMSTGELETTRSIMAKFYSAFPAIRALCEPFLSDLVCCKCSVELDLAWCSLQGGDGTSRSARCTFGYERQRQGGCAPN